MEEEINQVKRILQGPEGQFLNGFKVFTYTEEKRIQGFIRVNINMGFRDNQDSSNLLLLTRKIRQVTPKHFQLKFNISFIL